MAKSKNVIIEGISGPQLGASIGEWVKSNAVAIGERELVSQVAKGFDAQPVVITDGVPRRDYHDVKPFGVFEFARRANMADAVLWALDQLKKLSPVGPDAGGHYRDDHVVMINGAQIVGDVRAALMAVKPDDRVQIVNIRIYARKIEGATANKKTGRGKRKALSRQARNGVYRVVVPQILARYGRTLFADYNLVHLNLGAQVWGKQGGGHKRGGKYVDLGNRKRVLRDQVYPSVSFYIKPPT